MENKEINYNHNCYCIYCKNKIDIGEEIIIKEEVYLKESIEKIYHVECLNEDEDDIYLIDENE